MSDRWIAGKIVGYETRASARLCRSRRYKTGAHGVIIKIECALMSVFKGFWWSQQWGDYTGCGLQAAQRRYFIKFARRWEAAKSKPTLAETRSDKGQKIGLCGLRKKYWVKRAMRTVVAWCCVGLRNIVTVAS